MCRLCQSALPPVRSRGTTINPHAVITGECPESYYGTEGWDGRVVNAHLPYRTRHFEPSQMRWHTRQHTSSGSLTSSRLQIPRTDFLVCADCVVY